MPVYYLRTGNATSTTTVNLNSTNRWALELLPGVAPPGTATGTLSPSYTDPSNEFVIDANSGGVGTTTANSLPLTVTSNLTIVNLSFGGSNLSTTPSTFTKAYLNISAGITLTVTGTLQLNNGNMHLGSTGGAGALRLNTNNTGKLSIQGNLNLGYHSLVSQSAWSTTLANISVDGGQKSIIEFAGPNPCLVKVSSAVGANTTGAYLTIGTAFSANVADSVANIQIDFNKTNASGPGIIVSNIGATGIRLYSGGSLANTFCTINSNYDTAASNANGSRYNSSFLNLRIAGTACTIASDSKEIIFPGLIYINNSNNYLILSNSSSPFKVTSISNNIVTDAGFLTVSAGSIVEIYNDLNLSGVGGLNTNIAGGLGIIRGSGTIKFVGTSNSTITLKSYTEAEYLSNYNKVSFVDVNIEVNKTGGATLSVTNNITDLFVSRLTLYKSSAISNINFTHTSGAINCQQLYCFGNTTANRSINFIGNPTQNTVSKLVVSTGTTVIGINTTPLRVNEIEFRPAFVLINVAGASTGTFTTTFTGNAGFIVNNLIHTNSVDSLANRVTRLILSSGTGVTYLVNNSITMLGLSNLRAVLESDSRIENIQGTLVNPNGFTTVAPQASITTRHYISQYRLSNGLLRRTPIGMIGSDVTSQSSFPKISNITNTSTFVLSKNVSPSAQRAFDAGIPAVFRFTGNQANLNINYVITIDIDSSNGTTIKADNSYQNRVGIPYPNMWRTINWDALTPLLPNVIEAYVE